MIGDLYELTVSCLGNHPGTKGIVFDEYPAFGQLGTGIQVIFVNGEYDGFSPDEQKSFLHKIGHAKEHENYEFKNVMVVCRDFESGMWSSVLDGEKLRFCEICLNITNHKNGICQDHDSDKEHWVFGIG